jgi:hypothetical protein
MQSMYKVQRLPGPGTAVRFHCACDTAAEQWACPWHVPCLQPEGRSSEGEAEGLIKVSKVEASKLVEHPTKIRK